VGLPPQRYDCDVRSTISHEHTGKAINQRLKAQAVAGWREARRRGPAATCRMRRSRRTGELVTALKHLEVVVVRGVVDLAFVDQRRGSRADLLGGDGRECIDDFDDGDALFPPLA